MIAKGTFLKVKTRTKDDVFGEVVFEVVETGNHCRFCGGEDGMKCVMLGGSGPAARPGYPVHDCDKVVANNIAEGIAQIIPEGQARAFAKAAKKAVSGHSGSGCIEL